MVCRRLITILSLLISLGAFHGCLSMHRQWRTLLSGGRLTRFYQGDPIGTAENLVNWLVEQAPGITVQKFPEPCTNDGLVLEICGQMIYQFIMPGGACRISKLPSDSIGVYRLPGLMLWIIRQYDCEIKFVYAQPTHSYLVFRLDWRGCQLNSNPVIPGRLYPF